MWKHQKLRYPSHSEIATEDCTLLIKGRLWLYQGLGAPIWYRLGHRIPELFYCCWNTDCGCVWFHCSNDTELYCFYFNSSMTWIKLIPFKWPIGKYQVCRQNKSHSEVLVACLWTTVKISGSNVIYGNKFPRRCNSSSAHHVLHIIYAYVCGGYARPKCSWALMDRPVRN